MFGGNDKHQCSSIIKDDVILVPHIISKTKEIGILESSFIEKVIIVDKTTFIFVDPNKNIL